ncbi:MAG TPA: AAA family ATPase [Streptosporangiaceae bacterium]|nr:AAA family ATPase [Streptosporangiaceae bacterium]
MTPARPAGDTKAGGADLDRSARAGVDVAETHAAIVFFVGDRAYKLKKPVNLGFLDFSTPDKRMRACRREVELNRRFSPDVYLGVRDIVDSSGIPCDHLVVMRRMPADRRLATLVRERRPVDDAVRSLAKLIAGAHAAAPRRADIAAEGTRDALRARWSASFDQVRAFHGRVLDTGETIEIERLTERFLSGRKALFDERVAAGRVVDGHGDLLADDIFCLDDGPRVLDCLDFDDRLRWLDGLDDAMFLAMDLERLGAPRLAERFTDWYAEYAGDPAPPSLRHHYVAYRAFVRAKVACLRWSQGADAAAAEAGMFARIALRHLRAGAVTLAVVGGLPGTGKSTVAAALADRLGATLLASDRIRKELAGLAPEAPAGAAYGAGIYTAEWTRRCYEALLRRAEMLLARGETVIVDASFTAARDREAVAALGRRLAADVINLRCATPADQAARRLRTRPRDVSDADPAIAARMAESAEPWPEAVTIDTSGAVERAVARAAAVVRPHGIEDVWSRRPRLAPD